MHASAAILAFALTLALSAPVPLHAQEQDAQPRFRASVDVVTIAAVVRDKQGRVVPTLTKDDFTVLDGGQTRPIVEFQPDSNGPISVALLIDGSGSMRQSSAISKRVGETLLNLLNARSDDVALMSFDTRLLTLREFSGSVEHVRSGLKELNAFGATSIYDAIAGASAVVAERARNRRAVIVLTDGADNWSSYTPQEVAWIASTIDVPVYVFAVMETTPEASEIKDKAKATTPPNPLAELARATGGDYFVAGSPALAVTGIIRLVEELRHQYLIAFEPSAAQGMRQLVIKTRKNDLRVSSRRWYTSGAISQY